MVKLAQTATSSDTGNDSITKNSATLLEMSSATSRIPQPIAMPIPLPAQIATRTTTPTPMCVTMPATTTSGATPTATITVNKNYHVPRGPAFVANMSTSSRSTVAAPIRAAAIGTATQVIRTVVPNRSTNSTTPLVLQAPVQWQKVRTSTANMSSSSSSSSLSNSTSTSNTTISSAPSFIAKPITVTASSGGHSQMPTRTQILTKNAIFATQSQSGKPATLAAMTATTTAATPAKTLSALVTSTTTAGPVVVVTASSSATVTVAPNYLPVANTQIRSLSTISLSQANSTNASKTHAVIHNSGNNSSNSNFTASRLLHNTNSTITKSAFQNMTPKPLTLTTLNSGKITIAPVQTSQQSHAQSQQQQPKLPANTSITVTGAPNARVTFSNPQSNILTRIANTVTNSKSSNSSTTSSAVIGNQGIGRLSTSVLQLQNVIVSTTQGASRSAQNPTKIPFPTVPITSGSASIQIAHLNKPSSNVTASTPIPVTVNMSASGQKIVQLDKTIGSTTITPLPFDQNNKNVNYSANILSQVIQSKVASSNQKPLTILNSHMNSAATGNLRLSQGGHASNADSHVKLPKIAMPNTSIVLSSVAKQLNNVTVTSVSGVTTTKAVTIPTHAASSTVATNLMNLANNDDITITVNKVTTSPRPTILRKRDTEGSLLRAAKNLSSLIHGSGSQNQTFETYAVNSHNNINSTTANHNSNSSGGGASSSNSTCSSTCGSSTSVSGIGGSSNAINSRSSAATDNEISPSNSSPDYFHDEVKSIEDDRCYDASPRKKRRKQQLATSSGDSVESKIKCDEMQFMINKPKAPTPVSRIHNGIGSGISNNTNSNHHSHNNSSVTNNNNSNNDDATQNEDELSSESDAVVPKRQQVSLLNCYQQSWKPTNNHFVKPTDVRPKIERKITIIDIANQSHITKKINGWRISYISSEINEIKQIEHSVNDRIHKTLLLESFKDKRHEKKICKIIELAKNAPFKALVYVWDYKRFIICVSQHRFFFVHVGNYQRCKIIKECLQSSEEKLVGIFNHKSSINDIISRCDGKRNFKKRTILQ